MTTTKEPTITISTITKAFWYITLGIAMPGGAYALGILLKILIGR